MLFMLRDIFFIKKLIVFKLKGRVYLILRDEWFCVVRWVSNYEYQGEVAGYHDPEKCRRAA